jgi:hypothetical protein
VFAVMFGSICHTVKASESAALTEAHKYIRKQAVVTVTKSGRVLHKWENGKKVRK